MTGAFARPRVEGAVHRRGPARLGHALGRRLRAASSSRTATSTSPTASSASGDSEIRADGLFSLGYPRDDGGEEIDARLRVARRDLDSLRHAFGIDDYPVSGRLSGEFHLTGEYERPLGFGAMTIDEGVAYGEPFQTATASLRFDGAGVRLDNLEIAKGSGAVTGAAFVGWDSHLFVQRRRPAHSGRAPARSWRIPQAPLSGLAEFTAEGSGTFDVAALRRASSASTICSSARRASARSPARWRCAATS